MSRPNDDRKPVEAKRSRFVTNGSDGNRCPQSDLAHGLGDLLDRFVIQGPVVAANDYIVNFEASGMRVWIMIGNCDR
jgi:hypothetical protein